MNRSLLLSAIRSDLRRNGSAYASENATLRWITAFLDDLEIEDSSQVRSWQRDYYLSKLKYRKGFTGRDLLQVSFSLDILFKKTVALHEGCTHSDEAEFFDDTPGIFRITG